MKKKPLIEDDFIKYCLFLLSIFLGAVFLGLLLMI